jgi:regulator of protease activity HflC (stomatin/prohibitin superfamily)
MEQAMRADRGKRAAILTAEGGQQSAILSAEGQKQSIVLNAEADRAATILAAEAEREALLLRAEGEAQAIERIVGAIKAAGVDETVLAYQRQQLLPRLAEGSANKVWFVPTDIAGALGQAVQGVQGAGAELAPPPVGQPSVVKQAAKAASRITRPPMS